jgi:hypothetical protein
MKKSETIEAEIINDEFKAPILKDIKYPVNKQDIDALLKEYAVIPDIDPDADSVLVAGQFAFVLSGHKQFVKARTTIEKIRKELKAPAIEYGKKVDDIAKEFQAKINIVEDKLLIQRKRVEDNEAKKQREAEELEESRINEIKRVINAYKNAPMECIGKSSSVIREVIDLIQSPSVEVLEEFYDEAFTIYANSQTQMRQMYDNQLLVENAQQIQAEKEAEAKRLQDAEDAKLQAEKDALAKQMADFQKQKDDFARMQREQQEAIDRQNAEREADELMKLQEAERKAKSINEKVKLNEHKAETHNKINEFDTEEGFNNDAFIDAVIDGKIPNIKWSPDGN